MKAVGLSSEQVSERMKNGLDNKPSSPKTKSYASIVFGNIFTFFNLVNAAVAILILSTGITFDTLKNTFFVLVVLFNSAISIFQEVKSKQTIDKLQIISSVKVNVVRDGKIISIPTEQVVMDDLIQLKAGNQVVADCVICEGSIDVDESMLTGESDAVCKSESDKVLAGSYVVSGTCFAKVIAVADKCYCASITKSAKRFRKNTSEILRTLMLIIKVMTAVNVPLGGLLYFVKVYVQNMAHNDVIISIGGSVIGMLPEGLVLLTTTVFTVTAMKLAFKRVMSQDMYSAEALARVDVLCLDKTGTLTTGEMELEETIMLEDENVEQIMADFVSVSTDENATAKCLKEYFGKQNALKCDRFYPFNSTKKMSAAYFASKGSYVVGAADFITEQYKDIVEQKSKTARVLMLAFAKGDIGENPDLPLKPLALFVLKDKLRQMARQTLEYFEQQDVAVKVISGDGLNTVKNIARQSGVIGYEKAIDMTCVKDEEIESIVEDYTVFARVTPEQKKQIILALKSHGHNVGMTGDGVNDVMALREADCSIAMAQGADAAKNVSQLVLLDSNFDALPTVVMEGRRSINNLKRSSSLFLVKTIFSLLLTIIFLFVNYTYPFEPIQLTLVSMLCTGTPSALLAFEPNFERIKGRFLVDILVKSVPAALAFVIGVCMCTFVGMQFGLTEQISTMCVIVAGSVSFLNLARVCSPFNWYRGGLFAVMLSVFVVSNIFLKDVFSLVTLTFNQYIMCAEMILLVVISYFIIYYIMQVISQRLNKN